MDTKVFLKSTKHTVNKLRESKRKLANLEIARRKRSEINDLINKEYKIRNGALNLLKACNNESTKERLNLEITFIESKIRYLKDQLSELNCDWTLYKMKNSANNSCNNSSNRLSVARIHSLAAPSTDSATYSSASSTSSSSSSSPYSYSITESTTTTCVQSPNSQTNGKHLPYSVSLSLIPADQYSYELSRHQVHSIRTSNSIKSNCSSSTANEHIDLTTKKRVLNLLPEITITPSIELSNNNNNNINNNISNESTTTNMSEFIPSNSNSNNGFSSFSFSPSSSSSISIPTTSLNINSNCLNEDYHYDDSRTICKEPSTSLARILEPMLIANESNDNRQLSKINEICANETYQQTAKSADIMIYLALKETVNKMDFSKGFKSFTALHYREDPHKFNEQMRQFNYFRESTIRLSYEPAIESIQRLFEYFNSVNIIEKRFFQQSQCDFVHFTWYDCINGIECTQKSIQFEKASILFNTAALYTQLAAICCDGNDKKLLEQQSYWQNAAGCLNYLNKNFSNSPSLDMSSFVLNFLIEIFMCQAFELKAKILMNELDLIVNSNTSNSHIQPSETRKSFICYANCAKIYSHISERYQVASTKLGNNTCIKNYLPEVWFYLIKVKSLYYKGLSHYYASTAIMCPNIDKIYDSKDIQITFDNLHDKRSLKINDRKSNLLFDSVGQSCYFQKQLNEQMKFYDSDILNDDKRMHLARAHMRESIVWQEEAIRQHSFCRKFSKDDYLHYLLRHYHDISLDKFMNLDSLKTCDFDDELFDALPISQNLTDEVNLKILEPDFQAYEAKDFFNLIGPIKVYSSENEISIPFSCTLKKQSNQQTFGITVKGDCPVRINQVDPKSFAYNCGIREGDYLIAIQDQDVRWSKHAQVVERIRSHPNSVKLTLISVRPIAKEETTDLDNEKDMNKYSNDYDYYDSLNEKSQSSQKSSNKIVDSDKKPFCGPTNSSDSKGFQKQASNLKQSKSIHLVNELTQLIGSSSASALNNKSDKQEALRQINENHIWSKDQTTTTTTVNSQNGSTKAQKRLYRLFKSPHSFILPNSQLLSNSSSSAASSTNSHFEFKKSILSKKLLENNSSTSTANSLSSNTNSNFIDAANKLCNIAKSASTSNANLMHKENSSKISCRNLFSNKRHSQSFKSLTNLNTIKFNPEDDEVKDIDFDESKLMSHLKAMKVPFTNTITLGRKFKKNVLKLSIFNSFSISSTSSSNQQQPKCSPKVAAEASNLANNRPCDLKKAPIESQGEASSPSLNNSVSSSSHKKSVKKQKKLKELKELKKQQELLMTNEKKDVSVNKERLLKLNNEYESSSSSLSIYKTL